MVLQNGIDEGETVHSFLQKKQIEWFATQKESIENKEQYWSEQANKLTWVKKWDKVCDLSDAPITKWFTGGQLNICYNLLDRHIESGHGEKEIFVFNSLVTNAKRSYNFNQIHSETTRLARVLTDYGVKKGDRIFIYFPTIPEAAFSMLATNRIGALQCVMPCGLPAQDLATRIDHAKPKIILTSSHGYHGTSWVNYKDIIDEACSIAKHKVDKVLVYHRHVNDDKINMVDGRDDDWEIKVQNAKPFLECVTTEATDPLFTIYTSGSTGEPKGIVHSAAGYATSLTRDATRMFNNNEEVLFATSSFAWIAGQMILLHVPLFMKQKVLLLEGDPVLTSDPRALYRLIEENKITRAFVRPGILQYLRTEDPHGKIAAEFDLKSLTQVLAGGETISPTIYEWSIRVFEVPLMNMYAQTEIATTIAGNIDYEMGRDSRNSIVMGSIAYPGLDVAILKEDGTKAKTGEKGRILIKLPLPPAGLATLLNDHERCKKAYFSDFPGYYDTKDEGYISEEGHLRIASRVDDVMKHANIYLAAQAIEDVVLSHPEVAECLVIPVPHLVLKEQPVTVYVAKKGINNNEGANEVYTFFIALKTVFEVNYSSFGTKKDTCELSKEIIERVSKHFGKAVTFGKAVEVKELPRTRTGKLHRGCVTALGRGEQLSSTGAVENQEVLADISSALTEAGYAIKKD